MCLKTGANYNIYFPIPINKELIHILIPLKIME